MDIGALDVYTIEPTLDPIIGPYYRPTAVQAKDGICSFHK